MACQKTPKSDQPDHSDESGLSEPGPDKGCTMIIWVTKPGRVRKPEARASKTSACKTCNLRNLCNLRIK